VAPEPLVYESPDEDSARWRGFPFREGDLVISSRSKHGTTWVQMICALLVFQDPALPAPLGELSPWLDWRGADRDEVLAALEAQTHRRFVKTHTPLDGVPQDPRATYLVVARHPLDAAVSLHHQGDNLDRERTSRLTGQTPPAVGDRLSLHDWLVGWITWDGDPLRHLDSLPGVVHHLGDAWARRDEANVVLLHYQDLQDDLEGRMRALAERLDIDVPRSRWPALVAAATFESMRARADELAPDPKGILKDRTRFFRRGRSGGGREVLSNAELAAYEQRAAGLAPSDLLAWLHRS
jgi:aryl sulfotransferase